MPRRNRADAARLAKELGEACQHVILLVKSVLVAGRPELAGEVAHNPWGIPDINWNKFTDQDFPDLDWEDVRSAYLVHLREPNRDPEWDELFQGRKILSVELPVDAFFEV